MSDDKRRIQAAEAQLARREEELSRTGGPTGGPSGGVSSGSGSGGGAGNIGAEAPLKKPPSRRLVFATVSFYLVAAIVMIFANKWVLNAISAPLTFLLGQLLIAVALLHLSAALGYFALPRLQTDACKALVPLIAINVLGLTFNTFCLQYVDASFYQVARGLILPFTVFASYFFLGTRSHLRVYIAVAVVCLGFFYGVGSERLTVSHLGVSLGVFSSITTSVHAIVVKRSLSVVPGAVDLAYYSNLLSALVIAPFTLLGGEIPVIMDMLTQGGDRLRTFVMGTLITGVFGFLICVAGFLSIKVTSPITHMVSSAVRGVVQTVLGAMIFGDIITTGRLGGIFFIIAGSLYYTYVKDQDLARAKIQYKAATTPRPGDEVYPMGDVNGSRTGRETTERDRRLEFELEMDEDEKELEAAERAIERK